MSNTGPLGEYCRQVPRRRQPFRRPSGTADHAAPAFSGMNAWATFRRPSGTADHAAPAFPGINAWATLGRPCGTNSPDTGALGSLGRLLCASPGGCPVFPRVAFACVLRVAVAGSPRPEGPRAVLPIDAPRHRAVSAVQVPQGRPKVAQAFMPGDAGRGDPQSRRDGGITRGAVSRTTCRRRSGRRDG